jgi:hypothetical protein
LYVFGEPHPAYFARRARRWPRCGRFNSHWNPLTVPDALNVNMAVCRFELIAAFEIFVPDGGCGGGGGFAVNVAVTAWGSLTVTLQVPAPEQAPLQPANVDPAAAVAVSPTGVLNG